MYKLLIFDLDGTLLNTSLDIHAVLNESLKRFNLPELSLEKTISYVGNGAKLLVERAVGENKGLFPAVYEYYAKRFADIPNDLTVFYEGEEEALKSFLKAGLKIAVVTNKSQRATQRVCEKFFSDYNLYAVIGQSDKYPLKPDPTSTLSVIKTLGVEKSECLFVGDGETDVLTAANAGIDCASVLWGYRTKSQLERAGAKTFFSSFAELVNFVL